MSRHHLFFKSVLAMFVVLSISACVDSDDEKNTEATVTPEEIEETGDVPGNSDKAAETPQTDVTPETQQETTTETLPVPVIVNAELQISLANKMLERLAYKEFEVFGRSEDPNFVISPLSTLNTTAMLLQASAGDSRSKILSTLELHDFELPWLSSWNVAFNNYLEWYTQSWGQADYAFAQDYIESLGVIFGSQFNSLDFFHTSSGAKSSIASWIPEYIKNPDSQLKLSLDSIIDRTRLIFANKFNLDVALNSGGVQFELTEGLWQEASDTQEKLPMLKVRGEFLVYRAENFNAIRVPLADDAVDLNIVMPRQEGFSQSETELKQILASFQDNATRQNIEFILPVFNVKTASKIEDIVPDGAFSKTASSSTCSPADCSELIPDDNKSYDYSTVNNQGFLYRESFKGESVLEFSENGLKSQAATMAVLNATKDEPVNVLFPLPYTTPDYTSGFIQTGGIISGSITVSLGNGIVMESCTQTGEAPGPTQARPFLFVISDINTGSIIHMGRISLLDGESIVLKAVCQSEKIEYADSIWPTIDDSVASAEHVLSDQYVANSVAEYAEKIAWTKNILNNLSFKSFDKVRSEQRNILASPASEFIVELMSKTAAAEDILNDWLSSWNLEINREHIVQNLRLPITFNMSVHNKIWIQSEYETKRDYLNIVADSMGAELSFTNFLHETTDSRQLITDWFGYLAENDFDFGRLIGNRTRFLYASVDNTVVTTNGELTSGAFSNERGVHLNVPMIKFSGEYNYFENDVLQSIALDSELNQLFVIMPKQNHFNEVGEQLTMHIENISVNLSNQMISFSVPKFSLNNVETELVNNADQRYSNASGVRPLLPLIQYGKKSFKFDELNFQQNAYSLTALAAPADDGTVGGFDGNNFVMYENPQPIFPICEFPYEGLPAVDARPFYFVLRDKSGIIKQIGQVQDVFAVQLLCHAADNVQ